MRRKINGKINKTKKKVITFIVIAIFLIVSSSLLILTNRKYLFFESACRELSSVINKFFINNIYSSKDFENNITSSKINYLQYENSELRKALSLKEANSGYVIAEVVNHTSQNFYGKLDIGKGYKDNIKKDYAVVNEKGLIGFISKTSKNVSEVNLLTSVNEKSMISVIIENNDEKIAGVLSGYDVQKKMFKVTDVVTKKDDLKGLDVGLSGYGKPYYKGIYVGKVEEEVSSNYGLSKTLWVKTDVSFDDLLFVAVVIPKWFS